eukprot:1144854-Pelagomonas_calceolata.AAC.6
MSKETVAAALTTQAVHPRIPQLTAPLRSPPYHTVTQHIKNTVLTRRDLVVKWLTTTMKQIRPQQHTWNGPFIPLARVAAFTHSETVVYGAATQDETQRANVERK